MPAKSTCSRASPPDRALELHHWHEEIEAEAGDLQVSANSATTAKLRRRAGRQGDARFLSSETTGGAVCACCLLLQPANSLCIRNRSRTGALSWPPRWSSQLIPVANGSVDALRRANADVVVASVEEDVQVHQANVEARQGDPVHTTLVIEHLRLQ